jgi:hypothetical protein
MSCLFVSFHSARYAFSAKSSLSKPPLQTDWTGSVAVTDWNTSGDTSLQFVPRIAPRHRHASAD